MLERMKVEDSLDIYAFICEMRHKRGLMVQTEVGQPLIFFNTPELGTSCFGLAVDYQVQLFFVV